MMKYFVYEMIDPRSNTVFYVGFSSREERLVEHIKEAESFLRGRGRKVCKNLLKRGVICKIIELGLQPEIAKVFETDSRKEALDEEIRLIALYGRRNLGKGSLTNMTDGGQGHAGRVMSDEEKSKARDRKLGKTYEEMFGEEEAARIKGEIRKKHLGKKMTGEVWNKGKTKDTDDAVLRMSEALKGKPNWKKGMVGYHSGEANPFFGKTHSDEARAKIAASRAGKSSWNKGKTGATAGKKRHYLPDGSFIFVKKEE